MPEPPALQGDKITVLPSLATTEPAPIPIEGAAGTAPPGAIIEITQLDSTAPPVATTARVDGGFSVAIFPEGEHRVVAIVDEVRSTPFDFNIAGNRIVPSSRPSCFGVTPGLIVGARAGSATRFTFSNACASAVTVQNPRLRLGLTNFSFDARFNATIAQSANGTFSINVAAATPATEQDIVFVDVNIEGTPIRYPLGIYIAP
ncbi:MAG: hypothetical protein ACOY0T_30440 [Myxococcota bacterium]